MIATLKYRLLGLILFTLIGQLDAQPDTAIHLDPKPPKNRELFHDNIDREQREMMISDGQNDKIFAVSSNEEVNRLLTRVLTRKVDEFQVATESDSLLDHRLKVNYLVGMANLLRYVRANWQSRKVNPLQLETIIDAYLECLLLDKTGKSIAPVIHELPYDAATAVMAADNFDRNPGFTQAQNTVLLKFCVLYPAETLPTLRQHPDMPFADSLIKLVARKFPSQLYTYAQASNKLGNRIHNIKDDLFVQAVAKMSRSKSGQQYFPFLDNIVNGKLSLQDIDAAEKDSVQYFRLLVKTRLEYVDRMLNGDTAYAYKDLLGRVEKKARDVFVTTINGLHNEPDAIRFRCIQNLTAEELYYLAVLTDGLIYTSSYTNGVYPLMMRKIHQRGDSLLLSVRFDHYRKFISQAAAYNTLGNFLNTFPSHDDATDLMKAFVGNLERTDGLEDGVDVADSYASIVETNSKLAAEVLELVQKNYSRNVEQNNQRGMVIYNILNKLFLSADSASKTDLTAELGIPPVYNVPFQSLVNQKGEVVAQVFFYGDEDGRAIFNGFQNMFPSSTWTIDRSNPQWITIRSTKGRPVVIYANRPLSEETGEDDQAQRALGDYLEKNKVNPTVTIHRGHSYFANSTISYMAPSSRVVFMGSCGGYHLIDAILHKSSDAHIIASKQIGKTAINRPFFQLLTEKLRNGQNIDWIPFWKEFKTSARVEGFEDYIPPYKNLGAIFIKAYRIAMGEK
jgi:hypothetical protein